MAARSLVIDVQHLHKRYRLPAREIVALDDVSLHVDEGAIFGIIGRSGAGKSTLIRCLNLLERPEHGSVRLRGEDLTALDAGALQRRRQRIGMVFQHFNLLHSRTVAGNVRFPLQLAGGHDAATVEARVDEVLALVGLSEHRDKHPAQLSGGQKQRVGIARALANHPDVLLCDEATSALDPETTEQILALLADINRRLKLTIVLITHDMRVIHALCDRVAVIDRGRIVEQGPVVDVFLQPESTVTRSLLAHAGLFDEDATAAWRGRFQGPVLRLRCVGAPTLEAVLERLRGEAGLRLNLLQGTLSQIKGTPFARLLAGVVASAVPLAELPAAFARQGVHCEVLA